MTNLTHILIVLVIFFVLGLLVILYRCISGPYPNCSSSEIEEEWREVWKTEGKKKFFGPKIPFFLNIPISKLFRIPDSGLLILEYLKIIFNNFQTLWISRYLLTIFQSYKQIPKPHRPLKGHCTKNRSVKGQTWWTRCISWKIKREIWR